VVRGRARLGASFTATAVLDGKRQVRSAKSYVATAYDVPKTPETSQDTLDPRMTLMRDAFAAVRGLPRRGRQELPGRRTSGTD